MNGPIDVVATAAGSSGSAAGSGDSSFPAEGELIAVAIKTTATMALDVVLTARSEDGFPAQTLFSKTGILLGTGDGWYYPRQGITTEGGVAELYAAGGAEVPDKFYVSGYLHLAVANAEPADVVTVRAIFK